jgi:hypothetical protein
LTVHKNSDLFIWRDSNSNFSGLWKEENRQIKYYLLPETARAPRGWELFGTRRAKPTKYRKNRDKAEMNVSDMYERQRSRIFELDHIFQEKTVNEGISRADPF